MEKIDLMKKFYFLVFFCLFTLSYGQSVQLYNPPNTSDVYPDEQYFCAGESFNLKVDAVASSTGDYEMTAITDFAFSNPSTSVPFTNRTGNDHFSSPVTIPFTFNFYGKDYTQVVVGSNGRLLFGSSVDFIDLHLNRYVDQVHSGNSSTSTNIPLNNNVYSQVDSSNPSQSLNLAQIFFGFTDLGFYNPSSYDKIKYGTGTYQGVSGLLITFSQVLERTVGSGYDKVIDSQVLLLSDNRIIINVIKTTTTNAILGLQNEDASKFKVPTHSTAGQNYNNGSWKSEGKAWLFTPNQNLTPVFKWFRNGVAIPGETSDILNDFTPVDGDVLKIEVSYVDPDNGTPIGTSVFDQIIFKKIAVPVITSSSGGGCVSGITLTVPNDPDLNFEWFMVGNPNVLGTGNTYFASQTGSYFVKVSRKTLPSCSESSAPVLVNLSSSIPPFNASNAPFNFCESFGASNKTINLYDYYPANPSQYSLIFKDNGVVIPDPSNFVLPANVVKTIAISVNDPVSGCTIDTTFDLRFDSLPQAINNLTERFCFGETSINVSQYLQDLAGANFAIFDYQYSTNGTSYSTNPVINPKLFSTVWVKIVPKNSTSGTCNTISTIAFTEDAKVVADTPTTQLPPQCSSSFSPFNLVSLVPEINPGNVTISFHNSISGAQSGTDLFLNDSSVGSKIVYIRVVDNVTGCVSPDHPEITLLVYRKPTLIAITLSGLYCEGNTNINITQNAIFLAYAPAPITVSLEYYSTNGILLSGTQITNYDTNLFGVNPYVKLIYNATCSDIIPMHILFLPKPVAIKSQILVCSEVTYSLQNLKNEVISNSSNYTFTDLSGNQLPLNFNLSTLPLPVEYLIKDNATGCISDPQTVTFVQGGNSVLLATETNIEKCDTDFDGKTEFNLDDVKTDFTTDPNAIFEYFKDASFSQLINSNYTNETAFAQTVYVRITLRGFCPSSAKINLKVNTPTKSSTLQNQYFICFGETITIDAGSENTTFKWSTGETSQTVDFKIPGNYSVLLTNAAGCFYTHNFIISDENQPKIQVINQTNSSIEVIAEGGTKPYIYYFNGIPQSSNILSNPTSSSYVIQVESDTGCLGPPKTVYFIKVNNAFTPNGDGINDTWKIDNLDKMEKVSIVIVDRNGTKVFESTNPTKAEWDGKHNGRALPTASYWYTISWYDAVTQKSEQRQGWILMKNRN